MTKITPDMWDMAYNFLNFGFLRIFADREELIFVLVTCDRNGILKS